MNKIEDPRSSFIHLGCILGFMQDHKIWRIWYKKSSKHESTLCHCYLRGSWPRFKVSCAKQIPTLLSLSASIRGARNKVSPEAIWGDAGTKFPHPEISVMSLFYPRSAFVKISWPLWLISVTSINRPLDLCEGLRLDFVDLEQGNYLLMHIIDSP